MRSQCMATTWAQGTFEQRFRDVQERDEYNSPKYRRYHGRQIPIYNPPSGIGLIDKIRGEAR